jgi:hypothetical protein
MLTERTERPVGRITSGASVGIVCVYPIPRASNAGIGRIIQTLIGAADLLSILNDVTLLLIYEPANIIRNRIPEPSAQFETTDPPPQWCHRDG